MKWGVVRLQRPLAANAPPPPPPLRNLPTNAERGVRIGGCLHRGAEERAKESLNFNRYTLPAVTEPGFLNRGAMNPPPPSSPGMMPSVRDPPPPPPNFLRLPEGHRGAGEWERRGARQQEIGGGEAARGGARCDRVWAHHHSPEDERRGGGGGASAPTGLVGNVFA